MTNRNELVRRLLSGITMSELRNLVNIREAIYLIVELIFENSQFGFKVLSFSTR